MAGAGVSRVQRGGEVASAGAGAFVVDVPATVFAPFGTGVPAAPSEGLVLLFPAVFLCAEVPGAGASALPAALPLLAAFCSVGLLGLKNLRASGGWAMADDANAAVAQNAAAIRAIFM
jgi:hypothetical protein